MSRPKISIIGAGNVGGIIALQTAQKELGDVLLVDVVEGMPQGKALDISQMSGILRFDSKVTGTNDFSEIKGSDIVAITAGVARKPGMTREDLLKINADIIKKAAEAIKTHAPNAIVIAVTNPLDIMTQLVFKTTGFAKNKVMGMAGVLDSARFAHFIAEELKVSPKDISPMVLGSHGDTMVPLPRYSTVSGVPITDFMKPDVIKQLVERTANGGAEIVKLLKTGSAYFAPGTSVAIMIESILKNQRRVLTCSAYLTGEYGLNDVFIGVPVELGRNGIENIVELNLSKDEKKALHNSAEIVKDGVDEIADRP
ncbi:MAG: malate dehydrogenase [Candidatus Firestonebacteria bacterium RIFOXYC2_FULL_39_67]|nr:MAG: malate dehydrogenase [Candidatus Firestonebacteria bacterium RIFOXYD2_FULL_39_29]OGF53721.1 MAG: malate dehydrogenase [Candidatus Firestonebacteria bacterium RIFOXYC2_FULL_39_67]